MRTLRLSRIFALCTTVAGTACVPAGVFAQSDTDTTAALEEIIVTATHRLERLLDVPASITVLDSTSIAAKNAQDFRDYLTTVPGVNFTEGNLGQMRVVVRGISDGVGSYDPLTGIYIDETPATEAYGPTLDPDIYDLERVEVLKGPQGTLYGAGSMGGTIRLISKKPVADRFEASGDATVSSTEEGDVNQRVNGAVNVPIINDRLAVRFSGGYRKDAGWVDDIFRGVEDANDIEKQSLRGQLLLHPGEDTSVILSLMYQKGEVGQPNWEDIGQAPYRTSRAYSMFTNTEAKLYSLTVQHDADWLSLTSATNYLTKDSTNGVDFTSVARRLVQLISQVTLGPTEGVGLVNADDFNLFTQEVRLASTGNNVIDWTAGAFYSNATTHFVQTLDFTQAPSLDGVATGPGYLTMASDYVTRQIAVFGELTYNMSERFSATAGVRVFDVTQPTTTVGSGPLNGGNTQSHREKNSNSHTAKFALKYQLGSDSMIYAQAAQGYRNGAAGTPLPPVCLPDAAALGYTTIPEGVDPDKLWNYEIGTKNVMLDGRLATNAAVFYIDWSDIQNLIGLACGGSFGINGGNAVSKGAELELSARPIAGLTLNGSVSYADAYLTEVAAGVRASRGDPLPQTSKWSWNASAQYEARVTDALTAFVRAEANNVGDRWNTYRTQPNAISMEDYTAFTLRLGASSGNWSAAVFATNFTDEHIVQYNPNTTYRQIAAPRTIGLNVKYSY